MKDHIATIKRAIEHKNVAMLECIDLLMLSDNIFTVGKTRDGFASWAVNSEDDSSYWGHYFSTYEVAVADMYQRAGVPVKEVQA